MPEISPTMTLLQIIELRPETEAVFHQYEKMTGSCLLCHNLFDTLENVATQYSLNLDDLFNSLQTTNKLRKDEDYE